MKLRDTMLLLLATMLLAVPTLAQDAQEVTVRQINEIRATALDSLNRYETLGLTAADIQSLATPILTGVRVKFTAFVLTDVRNSGLATYRPAETPPIGRVHIYVRDTSAISMGVAGMDIQVVDGDFESTGILGTIPGDVVEVDGIVSPYFGEEGVSMQLSPISIVVTGETFEDFGATADIVGPVAVTSSDINRAASSGQMTINWDNYERLNSQYVRLEGVTVVRRDLGLDDQRPDFDISSDDVTVVPIYDTSLRYRNDRNGEYYSDFNVRANDDDYVPPPPGSVVNIQGNIIFQGDDPFGTADVGEIQFLIIPWSDADVEVLETPPQVGLPSSPDGITGNVTVDVTSTVTADPSRTITDVSLKYYTSMDATVQTLTGTPSGDEYSFTLPAQEDETFVYYSAEATDNTGATSESQTVTYRVLTNGITKVDHVQNPGEVQEDTGLFRGYSGAMNLNVVVTNLPGTSGEVVVQDDADLAPWTGVMLRGVDAGTVNQGDVLNITQADIIERFGVTMLENVTFTATGTATPYGYKTVPTSALTNERTAEEHEGMLVRFENVTIIDDDAGFGEWTFSSDGTAANAVRADDQSDALGSSFAPDTFAPGEVISFIQGIWWYSFGAYKLVPEDPTADIGTVVNTAVEDGSLPNSVTLSQNYPNPFNPETTIQYSVASVGKVKLQVFDMLGREVAVLVDREVAPGTYQVQFNASDLASGMYVYRLEAADKSLARTLMLLK